MKLKIALIIVLFYSIIIGLLIVSFFVIRNIVFNIMYIMRTIGEQLVCSLKG